MANPWFKFYGGDYLGDQKIFCLTTAQRSCWITLLCCASQSNGIVKHLTEDQLMMQSGVNFQEDEWGRTKGVLQLFKNLEMIGLSNGRITVKNWKKRQETSLTNAERQSRFRDRNKKVTGAVTEVTLDKIREEEIREDKNKREGEITPAQEARSFFEGNFESIFKEFADKTGAKETALKNEFQKFILYWTEKNKTGTKERWEKQETFEVKRRLATWLGRSNQFQIRETSKGRGLA